MILWTISFKYYLRGSYILLTNARKTGIMYLHSFRPRFFLPRSSFFSERCEGKRGGNDTLFFPSVAFDRCSELWSECTASVAISYVDANSHLLRPILTLSSLTASLTDLLYLQNFNAKQIRVKCLAFHIYSIINHNKVSRARKIAVLICNVEIFIYV